MRLPPHGYSAIIDRWTYQGVYRYETLTLNVFKTFSK